MLPFYIAAFGLSVYCSEGTLTIGPKSARWETLNNVDIFLYTRRNYENPELIKTPRDIKYSYFDMCRKTYFVIHGIQTSFLESVNTFLRTPLLDAADINLFYVDYSRIAFDLSKYQVVVESTARYVAKFIRFLMKFFHLLEDDVTLVGHSLGSHVAGEIGRHFQGRLGTIVALDPARVPRVYVDFDKAKYVQAIHTSTLGLLRSVGHANYYVNCGKAGQPGCNGDVGCEHIRAMEYYGESLSTGGYTAWKCAHCWLYHFGF